jgi:hemerythrin superfamily protein
MGNIGRAVDEVATTAMGGMKAAKATLEGLSGVFRQLATEHGEVSALLQHIKMSSDPKVRAEMFPKIRAELLSHEKGELAVVYPALRAHPETQEMADQHDREASQLEKVINELSAMPVQSDTWELTLSTMIDLVQRHVAEEENQIFPAGQRVLGKQSEALLARYEAARAEAKNRLA